jgi:hypothetical protein
MSDVQKREIGVAMGEEKKAEALGEVANSI